MLIASNFSILGYHGSECQMIMVAHLPSNRLAPFHLAALSHLNLAASSKLALFMELVLALCRSPSNDPYMMPVGGSSSMAKAIHWKQACNPPSATYS